MKTVVIKSNQGNHTGFNRKWTLIGEFTSLRDAREELRKQAYSIAEKHNGWYLSEGGFMYNEEKEFLYTPGTDNFSDDGVSFEIVKVKDLNSFFDGQSTGYMPTFVKGILGL